MKLVNKIGKVAKAMILGVGLAYITSCGGEGTDVKLKNNYLINNPPKITTSSLENAVAGEYYKKEIDVYDGDGDTLNVSLVSAPEGMTLKYENVENKYYLEWSPIHSTIGPNFSQTGTFPVEINVTDEKDTTTKTLDLVVLDNLTTLLGYLRTNEDTMYVCKPDCNFNENYLYKKTNGMFTGVKLLEKTIGSKASEEKYNPIVLVLIPYTNDPAQDSKNCTATFNYLPKEIHGITCILQRTENCNIENKNCNGVVSTYASGPDALEDQQLVIHEVFEGTFLTDKIRGGNGEYNLRENLVQSTAGILTDWNGSPYLIGWESFCDERINDYMCHNLNYLCLTHYLCEMYGFDIDDLPNIYEILKENTTTDTSSQHFKCVIDSVVTEKKGASTNTYDAFSTYTTNSSIPIGTIEDNFCEK